MLFKALVLLGVCVCVLLITEWFEFVVENGKYIKQVSPRGLKENTDEER